MPEPKQLVSNVPTSRGAAVTAAPPGTEVQP
jgi:hypothetical protein